MKQQTTKKLTVHCKLRLSVTWGVGPHPKLENHPGRAVVIHTYIVVHSRDSSGWGLILMCLFIFKRIRPYMIEVVLLLSNVICNGKDIWILIRVIDKL